MPVPIPGFVRLAYQYHNTIAIVDPVYSPRNESRIMLFTLNRICEYFNAMFLLTISHDHSSSNTLPPGIGK